MNFDVEVIFSNDGSVDNSRLILKELEDESDIVKVIHYLEILVMKHL